MSTSIQTLDPSKSDEYIIEKLTFNGIGNNVTAAKNFFQLRPNSGANRVVISNRAVAAPMPKQFVPTDKTTAFGRAVEALESIDVSGVIAAFIRPLVFASSGQAPLNLKWELAFLNVNVIFVGRTVKDSPNGIFIDMAEYSSYGVEQFKLCVMSLIDQESVVFVDTLGQPSRLATQPTNLYVLDQNAEFIPKFGLPFILRADALRNNMAYSVVNSYLSQLATLVAVKLDGKSNVNGFNTYIALSMASALGSYWQTLFVTPLGGHGFSPISTYGASFEDSTKVVLKFIARNKLPAATTYFLGDVDELLIGYMDQRATCAIASGIYQPLFSTAVVHNFVSSNDEASLLHRLASDEVRVYGGVRLNFLCSITRRYPASLENILVDSGLSGNMVISLKAVTKTNEVLEAFCELNLLDQLMVHPGGNAMCGFNNTNAFVLGPVASYIYSGVQNVARYLNLLASIDVYLTLAGGDLGHIVFSHTRQNLTVGYSNGSIVVSEMNKASAYELVNKFNLVVRNPSTPGVSYRNEARSSKKSEVPPSEHVPAKKEKKEKVGEKKAKDAAAPSGKKEEAAAPAAPPAAPPMTVTGPAAKAEMAKADGGPTAATTK